MIKQLLETQIREQIPTEKCAVLLSGGVDSLSVALAAHNVGKKVVAYSFHLEGKESYDFKTAQKVAWVMGWTFKPTIVPTDNLFDDWLTLVELECKKKTHFECVFPFLYMYPYITEEYVLTGWGADGYFGVSKKAQMRYGSEKGKKKYHEFFKDTPHKEIFRNGIPSIKMGGNVGTTSYLLTSLVLKASSIGLMGIEFSWSDETPYHQTQYYDKLMKSLDNNPDRVKKSFKYIKNDNDGKTYMADPVYYAYFLMFQEIWDELPNNIKENTYNLTKEGILNIKDLKSSTIEKFLEISS